MTLDSQFKQTTNVGIEHEISTAMVDILLMLVIPPRLSMLHTMFSYHVVICTMLSYIASYHVFIPSYHRGWVCVGREEIDIPAKEIEAKNG